MLSLLFRFVACSCTLVLACGAGPVAAQGSTSSLHVRATVLKHARLNVIAAPATFVITESDVARGYVDVATRTEISIQSNSQDGYALEFAASGDLFERARVEGLAAPFELGRFGGVAVAPAAAPRTPTAIRLAYRLVLSDRALPGAYAWPIRLSVTPL